MSPDEADHCLESAYQRYPEGKRRNLTELGNAERLVDAYGANIHFVPEINQWILWNGYRWEFDGLNYVYSLVKKVVRSIPAEAKEVDDDDIRSHIRKHAKSSERLSAFRNAIDLAAKEPKVSISAGELDADDMLFGVANGAIVLKSGAFRDPNRNDLMTKHGLVAYDAAAKCPRWESFISEITGKDAELTAYLHRCIGYCLIGGNPEQVLLVLHGTGANGKSTFIRVLQCLFGSYAKAVENSLFMDRTYGSPGGPREDVVRLKDARLIFTTEVGEGHCLNEDLVKRMTGDDVLSGRVPYGKSTVEFRPKFTPIMAANHKPIIRGGDYAIWRRVQLVPFTVQFAKDQQDSNLTEKLIKELPGILNWAVEGCLEYQNKGLQPPRVVRDATAEYKRDMDLLADWREENCDVGSNKEGTNHGLYTDYRAWCERNGAKPLDRKVFGRKLVLAGFESIKTKGQRGYSGISLRNNASDDPIKDLVRSM